MTDKELSDHHKDKRLINMIELNEKTQQDFLNREWVEKLLDAGVDMSDAKYYISTLRMNREGKHYIHDVICYKDELDFDAIAEYERTNPECKVDRMPTYTVSELLYKLHEWIYPTIDGEEYYGGLRLSKDAPFYLAYYHLQNLDKTKWSEDFYAEAEYPIESLASLLIQCHEKDIGMKEKDTGNISNK